MKLFYVFKKSLKENIRDWKILSITILFAPFMVYIMYLFYGDTSNTSYNLIAYNKDISSITATTGKIDAGNDLLKILSESKDSDGKNIFNVSVKTDIEAAKDLVKQKKSDILIVIPEDFSKVLADNLSGIKDNKAKFNLYGNLTNSKYIQAAVFTDSFVKSYVSSVTRMSIPVDFTEEFLEKAQSKSGFSYYVPAVIVFSIIMILFTASASIIKEVDKGTIKRLQISELSTFEFLGGISLVQIIITAISVISTVLLAISLGFKPAGSIIDITIVGIATGASLMAISLILSSFIKTIFDLMTIGCFPFFIMMFFSGGMFPMPQIKLFSLGNHIFNVTDVLPTSHAVAAVDKIANFGMGLGDVIYEISMIIALTVIYFIIGVWLFRRKHLRTA